MLKKKLISIILASTMFFSVPVYAKETNSNLQVDGKTAVLSEAANDIDGSLYISGEDYFNAIGAQDYSYNSNTQELSATKNNNTITVKTNNININSNSSEISSSVTLQGEIPYIPVRAVSEKLGYSVGWDNENNTVVLIDKNKLLEENKDTYNIINKYLEFAKKFAETPYALKGTFNLSMQSDSIFEIPIEVTGNIEAITSKDKADMKIAINVNPEIFKTLLGEDANSEEGQTIISQFSNINIDYIFDLSTGMYYMRSPLFTNMGIEEGTWISIDMQSIFNNMYDSSFSFNDMLKFSTITDFNELLNTSITSVNINSTDAYNECVMAIKLLNSILGDSAFQKDEIGYTSKINKTIDNVVLNFIFSILTDENDTANGYNINANIENDKDGNISLAMSQNSNNSKFNMTIDLKDLMTIILNMDMALEQTEQTISGKPEDGSKIISFENILNR